MSGHTPGPWTAEPHGKTTALYSRRTDAEHGLRLMNLDDGDYNFAANARLIAAAPAMLAACRAAEGRIVSLYRAIGPAASRSDGSNGHAENDDVIRVIRAAIAAAEGDKS